MSGFVEGDRADWIPLPRESWKPAPYDKRDIAAVKACIAGTASPEQQRHAMRWIIYASGKHVTPYDPTSERNTLHAIGKGWLGEQIIKLNSLKINSNSEQGT